ncbi:hypothetical protein C8J57DRAFT_1482002, partial [Mycena rebaudengoi]
GCNEDGDAPLWTRRLKPGELYRFPASRAFSARLFVDYQTSSCGLDARWTRLYHLTCFLGCTPCRLELRQNNLCRSNARNFVPLAVCPVVCRIKLAGSEGLP